MSAKSEVRTAHHEAGHAVVASFLQISIRYATIIPSKDARGLVVNRSQKWVLDGMFDDSPRGVDRAERNIMVCFAGALAQKRLQPKSHWRNGCEQDFNAAMELLLRIAGEDSEVQRLYWKLLWRRAELIVGRRWKEIRGVAKALLEHRTLNKTDIQNVIDQVNGIKLIDLELGGVTTKIAGRPDWAKQPLAT